MEQWMKLAWGRRTDEEPARGSVFRVAWAGRRRRKGREGVAGGSHARHVTD